MLIIRILLVLLALIMGGCSTILTPTYGVRQGQLAVCPAQRDCISSQDKDPNLYIAPLAYTGSRAQARSDLLIAVTVAGQGRIVSNHRNYIRIEYPITDKSNTEYFYQPENTAIRTAPGCLFEPSHGYGTVIMMQIPDYAFASARINALLHPSYAVELQ